QSAPDPWVRRAGLWTCRRREGRTEVLRDESGALPPKCLPRLPECYSRPRRSMKLFLRRRLVAMMSRKEAPLELPNDRGHGFCRARAGRRVGTERLAAVSRPA